MECSRGFYVITILTFSYTKYSCFQINPGFCKNFMFQYIFGCTAQQWHCELWAQVISVFVCAHHMNICKHECDFYIQIGAKQNKRRHISKEIKAPGECYCLESLYYPQNQRFKCVRNYFTIDLGFSSVLKMCLFFLRLNSIDG